MNRLGVSKFLPCLARMTNVDNYDSIKQLLNEVE